MAEKELRSFMNLRVLKKSRHIPQAGDIFVMQLPDTHYLFGRVINTNANPLGVGEAILIYIYDIQMNTPYPIPCFIDSKLLVPPMMTNRLPWTKGYFMHLDHRTLEKKETLGQHCFFDDIRNCYRDEYGNKIKKCIEPIGDWGLDSYRTIDDAISEALEIPLAPD